MAKKTIPKELMSSVTEATLELLSDFEQLYVSKHHEDCMSAVSEGAVFIAVSRVDNDEDGDGFRYLIGLRRGTKVTPHLTCFFEKR
jgi:hypothetical protein